MVLFIASRFFEQNKYEAMHRSARIAANTTVNNYKQNNYSHVDKSTISVSYRYLGDTIGADFLLVSLEGDPIYYSKEDSSLELSETKLSQDTVNLALVDDYKTIGNLSGIVKEASYIVGVPVMVEGVPVAVLYATTSASDLVGFLKEMLRTVLIVSVIVLAFAFLVISYMTNRMVKPLQQMVDATHSFSKGDFSARIPVSSYDEVGQLSMAFNNMASALASMERSRRSFIANVSHELKTPMTTIGGFVDGILDGTVPQERRDEYLQIVSLEVQRLSRLVHSMLDTARIEGGQMEISTSVFDVSEIVRQTLFHFEQTIEEKEIQMEGLEVDYVMVEADEDLMHQVVYNVIENAVKFVNFKGTISFDYEQNKDTGRTTVSIRNSGDGLDKEDAEHIFDRFYKSDRSRTDSSSTGVGLGLHIVKSILQYHDGEIEALSKEGEYTEFRFDIATAPAEFDKTQAS